MIKSYLILALVVLSACSSNRDERYTGFYFPYKKDMHQGNQVKETNLAKLKIGMYKQQVEETIGEPLLKSDFNNNHWIYVQVNQIKGGVVNKTLFTLQFTDEKLSHIGEKTESTIE